MLQILERKYPEDKYQLQATFPVEFTTEGVITLDVDDCGLLETGWEITPLYTPSVSACVTLQCNDYHHVNKSSITTDQTTRCK